MSSPYPRRTSPIALAFVLFLPCLHATATEKTLPQTQPLTMQGDLAMQMVEGIDKYLMRELAASPERRKAIWKADYSSPEAYVKSLEQKRHQLRRIIGAVDERKPPELEVALSFADQKAPIARGEDYFVYPVRWPVFDGVNGAGLLLQVADPPVARVIAIPEADWTPEALVGMSISARAEDQYARRLAENGCQVIVPDIIDRKDTWSGNPTLKRMTNQPHREFAYRMSYQMGRHVIGYEVQKILALVDWFKLQNVKSNAPIVVVGYGEGALLALYAAAIDTRIDKTVVSTYLQPRESLWEEPIYRNVWSLLTEFGDQELVSMIVPRKLFAPVGPPIPVSGPPQVRSGRSGAAPGSIKPPSFLVTHKILSAAAKNSFDKFPTRPETTFGASYSTSPVAVDDGTLENVVFGADNDRKGKDRKSLNKSGERPTDERRNYDVEGRRKQQFDQLVDYTQKLVRQAETRRQEFFWSKLDRSSMEKYQKSCEPLRNNLWEEVIGKLPAPTLPPNARSRQIYDEPKFTGYEVVLDLYPDVFAEGILLVPKDLKDAERRPVVVCQHGLEGRPEDVCNPKTRTKYYNSFGAQLAERGFIVFAPQNPYIGKDKFRVLQRKANPLGLSLFSFIVRQHERILDWLATLPFVDEKRMAFYGLSYGGKTAMRVPAILERYCLSICSGDFNEWIWKNTSVDFPGSYMFTGEYEMFEFNLGNTFGYAEMAALIAPRPFMVERGHDDGVGIDEWVAYEYAKVRRHYVKLGIPDRTEIEFFNGGHEINGKGTFEFLHKHLKWPN